MTLYLSYTTKFFDIYLADVSNWVAVVCIIISVVCYKKFTGIEKIALLAVAFDFTSDIIAVIYGIKYHNNYIVYNISTVLEIIVVLYVYAKIINSKWVYPFIKYFLVGYVLLSLINMLFIQGIKTLDTFTYLPANIVIAVLSFAYLRQCADNIDVPLKHNFFFWYALASLLYAGGSVSVMGIFPWLSFRSPILANKLYYLNTGLYTTWYILITTGILWKSKVQK